MIIQKLIICFLSVWLGFQTNVCASPTKDLVVKNDKLSSELKQNALELLLIVSSETEQFKLAENRIQTRTIIADLMWQHDKLKAQAIFQEALKELQKLFKQLNTVKVEKLNDSESHEHYANRFRLNDLRSEYILSIAKHDSETAIEALQTLNATKISSWDPLNERLSILKFETAAVIAIKDSNRAYSLYKDEIAINGITLPLIDSFNVLHQKNPELTSKISKDILAIIKNAKIGDFSTPSNNELNFWQVIVFLNATSQLNRRAELNKELLPPLTEIEMQELAKLLVRAWILPSRQKTQSIKR